jgi:hypothetical protein
MLQANCRCFMEKSLRLPPSQHYCERSALTHCHPEAARAGRARSGNALFAVILSEAKDPTGSSETDHPAKGSVLQPLRGFGMTVHAAASPLAPARVIRLLRTHPSACTGPSCAWGPSAAPRPQGDSKEMRTSRSGAKPPSEAVAGTRVTWHFANAYFLRNGSCNLAFLKYSLIPAGPS